MYFIGLAVGTVFALSVYWLIKQNKQITWWQWLIAVLATLALFAAVQHFYGSLAENDTKAAWVGMGIFGIIAVILGVVDWRLIAGNKGKA
ncbi:dehalogenase [Dehalococcoides mccartyi]|jgi:ABC-type multidrug transport system permease subunit|nr:hypothetical protein [Dehalococcoides mccartyi]AII58508.1 dehalogenase [Dehalococcoides mccartyi CG1]APH13120.1 dehalogenase [Dehalococcoides mccartyi]